VKATPRALWGGLATQFKVAEHIPANHDEDLIAFLREAGIAPCHARRSRSMP
jgi:hypothetical protein